VKNLNRILMGLALILVVALAIQIVSVVQSKPDKVYFASWAFAPESVQEALKMSELVVLAKVTGTERGKDLSAKIDAEGEEDRIPTTVVNMEIEETYFGNSRNNSLRIFQTGLFVNVNPNDLPSKPDEKDPGPPDDLKEPREQPDRLPEYSDTEVRTTILDGDPPYMEGESYILFLTNGPDGLMRPIAPHGRFKVSREGTLEPVTDRDFAGKLRGQRSEVLVELIKGGRQGAPEPGTSIEVALDTDENGTIGDAEIQMAVQYWIMGEPVPGTEGEVIDDAKIRELIQIWISGQEVQ